MSGRDWDTDSESLTEEEIGRDVRQIMNNGLKRPPHPDRQAGRGRRIDEINRTVYTDEGLSNYETPRRELTKEDKKRLQKQEREELVGVGVKFQRIRRITGYLVGSLDRFNDAKRAEERDRVKHI